MSDSTLRMVADLLATYPQIKTAYLEKPSEVTIEGAKYLAKKMFERKQQFPDIELNLAFSEGLPEGVAEAYEQEEKALAKNKDSVPENNHRLSY